MLRLAWRGVAAGWSRFALVALAIALGVAFVTGSLILAQGIHGSYSRLVDQVTSSVDVFVRGPETDAHHGISDFAPVPAGLVATVRSVPGVAAAGGQVTRLAQLVTPSGTFLGAGARTYAYTWTPDSALLPFVLVDGRPPDGPGQVVIDTATASADGLRIGDPIRIAIDVVTPVPARIIGLVRPRSGGDLSGASAIFLNARWAQGLLGIGDRWDLIEVTATRGVAPEAVRDRLRSVVPDDGTSVITAKQFAAAEIADLARRAGSVTTVLLAIAVLALVIGSGVVVNALTIIVRQRTRELALLRVLGMSRSQVYATTVVEATLLGAGASVAGALVGVPAAIGLRGLVNATVSGADLPGLRVDAVVPVLAALLGTAVTAGASLRPAWQASRALPMEAWRDAVAPQGEARAVERTASGMPVAIAVSVGVASAAAAAFGPAGSKEVLLLVAAGAAGTATVAGVGAGAPGIVALLGSLASRTGVAGRIATAHAASDHRRLVPPAASLALGIGLVAVVAVMASTASASIGSLVGRADRADFVVVSDAAPGIDPEAVEALREAPTVATVTEVGADSFHVAGHADQFTALDTDTAAQTIDLSVIHGTLSGFADGDIAITASAARAHHLVVGDYVQTRFGIPQLRYLAVTAVLADNGITRDWVVPFETYRRGDEFTPIRTAFVLGIPGTAPARLRREVNTAVSGFPGVSVYDAAAYARAQATSAEGPVRLIEALVSLAIVIALIGVADALGLAVVERAPELGLLTALGMTRHQLASAMRWEAAFVAVLGGGLGIIGGVAAGLAMAGAVGVHGLTRLAVPVRLLVLVWAVVTGAAVGAATVPARRAGRAGSLALAARLQ